MGVIVSFSNACLFHRLGVEKVKKLFLLLTLFLISASFVACGPIKSTIVINDTQNLLERAKQIRAEEKPASQYYYYAAQEIGRASCRERV